MGGEGNSSTLCSEVSLCELTPCFSDVSDNLAILLMVRQGWEMFMTVFLSTRNPTVPPHRLVNIPVLGRLCSVLFPILPFSQCRPKPTELKNYFLSTSTGFISGSQRMHVSVPFKHSYPSSDTVSEGSWHPCSAAFLLSSEPHSQGLHTLSMSHCLAGCVTPFKLPALAPCPCTASALTGAAV